MKASFPSGCIGVAPVSSGLGADFSLHGHQQEIESLRRWKPYPASLRENGLGHDLKPLVRRLRGPPSSLFCFETNHQ